MGLENDFEKAAKEVKNLTERPSNDELLKLYSLFKQGTDGDVSGKRPGLMNIKGRAKYDAWAGNEGMDKNEAMKNYINLVSQLKSSYRS